MPPQCVEGRLSASQLAKGREVPEADGGLLEENGEKLRLEVADLDQVVASAPRLRARASEPDGHVAHVINVLGRRTISCRFLD